MRSLTEMPVAVLTKAQLVEIFLSHLVVALCADLQIFLRFYIIFLFKIRLTNQLINLASIFNFWVFQSLQTCPQSGIVIALCGVDLHQIIWHMRRILLATLDALETACGILQIVFKKAAHTIIVVRLIVIFEILHVFHLREQTLRLREFLLHKRAIAFFEIQLIPLITAQISGINDVVKLISLIGFVLVEIEIAHFDRCLRSERVGHVGTDVIEHQLLAVGLPCTDGRFGIIQFRLAP